MADRVMTSYFGSPLFGIEMLWDNKSDADKLRVTMKCNWFSQALDGQATSA
jgi:hypothetical protein